MFRLFIFLPTLLLPHLTIANPYYTIANGDWELASSWSLSIDGPAALEAPSINDTVYIHHAITHNTGGTYKHKGDVIIEDDGYLHINTGYGSSNVYKFEGNRFEVYGTLTTTSDFFHQASWTSEYGILILHEGSGFAIGDDLILCGTSETILNTINCGDAGSLDDIYFQGTQAKLCGQGNFIIPDRMRAWNDSRTEITPASTQIVNQICAGFQLFDDPGTCSNPVIVGGGTFVLKQRDFTLIAKAEYKHIRLRWQSDESEASARYFIERSHDGQSFAALSAHSLSRQEGHILQATDLKPLSGLAYYRIRQDNPDGAVSYSEVVSIRFQPPVSQLTVSHSPHQRDRLNLIGFPQNQAMPLRIINANGSLVQQTRLAASSSGSAELTLAADLPAGIYVIELLHPSTTMQARFVLP